MKGWTYGWQVLVDRMTGVMDTMSKISLKEKFNMHHWISYGRQVDGMTGAMDTMSEICLRVQHASDLVCCGRWALVKVNECIIA